MLARHHRHGDDGAVSIRARPIGRAMHATGRAMAAVADAVPQDVALGAWIINGMDAGLLLLPPSVGVAWRGLAVHGPGSGMPADLAARWEDAHRPGRDVQYFGYTSLMAAEGRQYPGDWQMAVYSTSARDLSGLTVAAEPELLVPRKAVFRVGDVRGYRWLEEVPMKPIKPSRQFALHGEPDASLDDMRRAGLSEVAIAALEEATRGAAERRAAWEAAGRPGLEEMKQRLQDANDLAFAGMPGYARNEVLGIFGPK